MESTKYYIACDLGAESGRVMLGEVQQEHCTLREIHRFENNLLNLQGSLHWNLPQIYQEILTGLKKVAESGIEVTSISVDSWGVDYVFYQKKHPMLGLPYHYRDERNDASFRDTVKELGEEEIFSQTGIQFMAFNTLYQLRADQQAIPGVLEAADGFLGIADYINYLLSGVARCEETLASTTQLYHPGKRGWAWDLIEKAGLPQKIFNEVVPAGTRLGPISAEVAQVTGMNAGVEVIAGCSHDTAAAVAAVPAEELEGWAYLSSGTWSLLGIERKQPDFSSRARDGHFTNEIGLGGKIRYLKNIVGLWIVQELRRQFWSEGNEWTYPELEELSTQAPSMARYINPEDARFLKPGQMREKIQAFCIETGQSKPESAGELVRCVYESLAFVYRSSLQQLEEFEGKTLRYLYVVGGGSRNRFLNQTIADFTGRRVCAGPAEATAYGNILTQAMAMEQIENSAHIRKVVRGSEQLRWFDTDASDRDEEFARFKKICTQENAQ